MGKLSNLGPQLFPFPSSFRKQRRTACHNPIPPLPPPPTSVQTFAFSSPPPSSSFSTLCCFFGEMNVALANDDISRRHRTISDDDNQQFPTNSDCMQYMLERNNTFFEGRSLLLDSRSVFLCIHCGMLQHTLVKEKKGIHMLYTLSAFCSRYTALEQIWVEGGN